MRYAQFFITENIDFIISTCSEFFAIVLITQDLFITLHWLYTAMRLKTILIEFRFAL